MTTATIEGIGTKTVELGYFSDGYGVYFAKAEVTIRHKEQERELINHAHTNGYFALSIVGELQGVTNGRRTRRECGFGQLDDTLRKMTPCDRFGNPQPMDDKTARLLDIWELWHLNDMRPGCMHQSRYEVKPGAAWNATNWYGGLLPIVHEVNGAIEAAKCPDGYKWGHAWLVELLPQTIHNWYAAL